MTDIKRVIDLILQELAAAGAIAPARCTCHGFAFDCCPNQVDGVLAAGASRLGVHAAGGSAGAVAGLIDHTLLKPDATATDIKKLCTEAAEQAEKAIE